MGKKRVRHVSNAGKKCCNKVGILLFTASSVMIYRINRMLENYLMVNEYLPIKTHKHRYGSVCMFPGVTVVTRIHTHVYISACLTIIPSVNL